MSDATTASVAHPLPPVLAACRRLLAGIGRVELALAIAALVAVVVLSTAPAFLRKKADYRDRSLLLPPSTTAVTTW